jgi:phytoene dehydrogenase-like protein
MTNAIVVGAGPNGLSAAIHSARPRVDVQVLSAGPRRAIKLPDWLAVAKT